VKEFSTEEDPGRSEEYEDEDSERTLNNAKEHEENDEDEATSGCGSHMEQVEPADLEIVPNTEEKETIGKDEGLHTAFDHS
jgi:hypothetical protein